MSAQEYLEAVEIHEVVRYAPHSEYQRDGVCFSGTVRKHPYDSDKLLVVPPPFVAGRTIYEFRLDDVLHAEDTSNLVAESGESIQLMNIWIRRGSLGVILHPFEVGKSTSSEESGETAAPKQLRFMETKLSQHQTE